MTENDFSLPLNKPPETSLIADSLTPNYAYIKVRVVINTELCYVESAEKLLISACDYIKSRDSGVAEGKEKYPLLLLKETRRSSF